MLQCVCRTGRETVGKPLLEGRRKAAIVPKIR